MHSPITSTKLVYNLVYRKDRGSGLERRGYWSGFLIRFGLYWRGVSQGAGGGSWIADLG